MQSHSDQDDEALIKLQETLAAAKGANKGKDGGIELMHVTEDPETQKKQAEAAEKDKIKTARRRQVQEERERERSTRVLGRSGLRTGYGGGLTVSGLEDDDGMATTRARPSKPKTKKPRRRNSEYSDEEDFPTRGRTREDEYDEDDGFLVGSDEEPEIVEDASEEEDEMDMGEEKASKSSAKWQAAEPDAGTGGARSKRRKIIDEDEDEE